MMDWDWRDVHEPVDAMRCKILQKLVTVARMWLMYTHTTKYFLDNWLKQPYKPWCQISQKENDIQFWVWNLNWKREEIRWLPLWLQKFE